LKQPAYSGCAEIIISQGSILRDVTASLGSWAEPLGKTRLAMRTLVIVLLVAEVLFWWVGVYRGHLAAAPLGPAGLHGMLLFFVTPALALVLWGRWLGFALVLVRLAAFMCVSVVGDGMISN